MPLTGGELPAGEPPPLPADLGESVRFFSFSLARLRASFCFCSSAFCASRRSFSAIRSSFLWCFVSKSRITCASMMCAAGSHVLKRWPQPTHLTRYSMPPPWPLR